MAARGSSSSVRPASHRYLFLASGTTKLRRGRPHCDVSSSRATPPSSDASDHERHEAAGGTYLLLIEQRDGEPHRATATADDFSSMRASPRRSQQLGHERGPTASLSHPAAPPG
ncbi:hypothetical protein Dimus_032345, partial [Dionaea muscipula]